MRGVGRNGPVKLMAILRFLASLFGVKAKQPAPVSPAQAMGELRTHMLTTAPARFGITPTVDFPRVYGVLMDWPLQNCIATVVAFCDGNASLYTTSTFGILGGIGHDSVRAAATRFVQAGAQRYDESVETQDVAYPNAGQVRYYLLCFDGLRKIDTEMEALMSGKDSRIELWAAGQEVLTELRLVTEKTNK